MRVTFFRLKGYVNILQGMGLDELVIPFNTLNSRIVLIQGENGTGKSTILNTLVPSPDSSDMFRTDVIVDSFGNRKIIEYPAEKEIHYVETTFNGEQIFYRILIQSDVDSTRTRRTTKAYISKNGEEYNPSGNVSSFKEARDSLMGIDSTYLDLSSVTSENRGLVDMIPSERRKHLASYIGNLDTYYEIFKNLSKKASNHKSYINTINNKMMELGNEAELSGRLVQKEKDLKIYKDRRDETVKDLADAEALIKVKDPDGKLQSLYTSIYERLQEIKSEIIRFTNNQQGVITKLSNVYPNKEFEVSPEKLLETLLASEKNLEDEKATLLLSISNLISANDVINKSIDEDLSKIMAISADVKENIETVANNLQSEIDIYKQALSDDMIKFFSLYSEDQILELKSKLDEIANLEKVIESEYSLSEIKDALSIGGDIKSYKESVNALYMDILSKEQELKYLNSLSEKFKDGTNDLRPKECKIDTCPYIKELLDFQRLSSNKVEMEMEISDNKRKYEYMSHVLSIYESYEKIFSSLYLYRKMISNIHELSGLLDKVATKKAIISGRRISSNFMCISDIISLLSVYKEYNIKVEQLKDLQKDLAIYRNSKKMIDTINESIKKQEAERNSNSTKIKEANANISVIDTSLNTISDNKKLVSSLIEYNNSLASLESDKDQLKKEYSEVKDSLDLIVKKVKEIENFNRIIHDLDILIGDISDDVTKLKFNIAKFEEYKIELANTSMMYEKISFIRNACSPGNGMSIQSEYVKRYMNDIIIKANEVLGYMFGGTIQIGLPIINEKEFRIPFIGPGGIEVPDISCGSTAQKCMMGLVFSSVSMMQSSNRYNIPRFDEIDGGLDQPNRITFIEAMNHVLDIMGSEQCLLCSHNMEFDTHNISRIICTHTGLYTE